MKQFIFQVRLRRVGTDDPRSNLDPGAVHRRNVPVGRRTEAGRPHAALRLSLSDDGALPGVLEDA